MPSLILLIEGSQRQSYPLGKATLMVGKDADSDLQLPSTSISSDHASIIFQDGEFILRDNGSPTGSFVNGEKVTRRVLDQNDIIRFGEYSFLVDLHDEQGLENDSTKKPTVSKEELEEEKTGEYVPAAKSKRSYSEIIKVKKPEGPDTKKLKALELRLTQPVPYTQVSASRKSMPIVDMPEATRSNVFFMVITIIVLLISTVLVTLSLLPIDAREAMVHSDDFQKIPFNATLKTWILKSEPHEFPILLKVNQPPFGGKLSCTKSTKINARLRFQKATISPMRIHLKVLPADKTDQPIFDESIEIKSGTDSTTLFSIKVKPGIYLVEGTCEQEAFVGENTAILDIISYF